MKKRNQLEEALAKLDQSARKIIETRGYTKQVEKIKILEEMIKEQLLNEDSRTPARSPR